MGCLLKANGLYSRMTVGAVLLAAGAGRRLGGRPKALLQLGGVPLVMRQLVALSGAGVDEVAVVLGHHAEAVEAAIAAFPITLVHNAAPDEGQASSVRLGLAALSYALLTRRAPLSIAPFFLGQALPGGGGANVVNVMLVDFRAFDTLGEITVLGIVGITVFALLRRFRPPQEALQAPSQQRAIPADVASDLHPQGLRATQRYLDVPAVLVRLLLPVGLAFALHLLLRGHNAPGGGFVAGLVVASVLVAQYMVSGTRWVEARARMRPKPWMGLGLLLALGTGLASLALDYPFLTSHTALVHWPLLGELHLPSAALFDLGVFAVVVGSTLLLLTALAHQSLRGRRQQAAAMDLEAERA